MFVLTMSVLVIVLVVVVDLVLVLVLVLVMVLVLVVVVANQLQLMWIVQQCSAFEEQPPMEGTARAASFSWKCQQLFNPLLLNPTKTLCFGNSMYNGNMEVGKKFFMDFIQLYKKKSSSLTHFFDQIPMTHVTIIGGQFCSLKRTLWNVDKPAILFSLL